MNVDQQFEQALRNNDVSALEKLLDQQPDLVMSKLSSGHSPIRFALEVGATQAVERLLSAISELNAFDACILGRVDPLAAALDAGFDLHELSHDGWTLLHLAGFFGQPDSAAELLARGASLDAYSDNPVRNQPLHAALAGACSQSLIEKLLSAGADVNGAGAGGVTPLHLAAARGQREIVDLLLQQGAGISKMDNGQTPMDLAIERGHPELATYLENP